MKLKLTMIDVLHAQRDAAYWGVRAEQIDAVLDHQQGNDGILLLATAELHPVHERELHPETTRHLLRVNVSRCTNENALHVPAERRLCYAKRVRMEQRPAKRAEHFRVTHAPTPTLASIAGQTLGMLVRKQQAQQLVDTTRTDAVWSELVAEIREIWE